MLSRTFFHVGVLVHDLDVAMADFSATLGVAFRPVSRIVWDDVVDIGVEQSRRPTEPLRLAYSDEGPPYLELIQATGDGVWGWQHGEGLHHIGVQSTDVVADLEWATGRGWAAQTLMHRLGAVRCTYMSPSSLHGTRVEFCPTTRPPPESMAESGDQPPTIETHLN